MMKYNKMVRCWLWTGVIMVFIQIVLGGITRLTGSGLSITKWEIVTGAIPPLNAVDWEHEFSLYKQTPQYQKINEGMSLNEFKFIYFWEYIHRIWARLIGFVFIIPFVFFWTKGQIDAKLFRQLGIAVMLGGLVAAFGWIMVASGLINRPWVNAYKLTIHLNLGILLYAWLIWVAIGKLGDRYFDRSIKKTFNLLVVFVTIQLVLGGLMSGMKAGVYYPTWPDMHGEFFPTALLDPSLWTTKSIVEYEKGLVPGIVQFLHRLCAYSIFFIAFIFHCKSTKKRIPKHFSIAGRILFFIVLVQVSLGIATVIYSVGKIPLVLGSVHQATAILLVSNMVYLYRKLEK